MVSSGFCSHYLSTSSVTKKARIPSRIFEAGAKEEVIMEPFSKEVRQWLQAQVVNRPTLRVEHEVTLEGLSGCNHRIDYSITRDYRFESGILLDEPEDLILVEIKSPGVKSGKRPTYQTYRAELLLAYAEFADFRELNIPKFVIMPYRQSTKGCDFSDLCASIGVDLIDYSNPSDRAIVEKAISGLI